MIDFTNETYKNILSKMLDNVPSSFDKREGSMIQTALGPAAYGLEEFYITLNQVQRMGFVQTAVGQSLDYLAVIANIERYPASKAVRLGVFNIPVPIGSRFSTVNGAESINFIVTAPTEVLTQYQLTAETAGTIGNDYSGTILPITFIEGLKEAQITDILIPGDDKETDDNFRERLIEALNEKPFGGNIASYRTFIMGLDGVGGVQVYPTWNGGGTVKCSIIGTDFMPASQTLIDNVQNAVDPPPNQGLGLGMAPIGAQVTITAPAAATVDVGGDVMLMPGVTLEQIKPLAEAAINGYLLNIRKNWDKPISQKRVEYTANVYRAQVIAAVVGVTGIINVENMTLNGKASDLILTQSGTTQEVPVLGQVTLNASA